MKQLLIFGAVMALVLSANSISGMGKDKIVGGVDISAPGYFVSLVESEVMSDNTVEYFPVCGGSLIHKDGAFVVLTAAHCVENLDHRIFVNMKVDKASEINVDSLVAVKAVVVHPGYDSSAIVNDLALLILDETSPLLKNPSITTIPIHSCDDEDLPGRELEVIGFGNATSYGDLYLDQMQSVTLNEVSLSECKKAGEDYENVDKRQICAGNDKQGKKDSCQGDSGGPLILNTTTGPELIGLVSWGVDCAQVEFPGVYTRPSSFKDWIDQQIDLFTPSNVRLYNSSEMKILSNAYCYSNNPSSNDYSEDSEYAKWIKVQFFLNNAEYTATTQIPDPGLPLDTCDFILPNGEEVVRTVALKGNVDQSGYEYEHLLKVGDKIFTSLSALKMEYKMSCLKDDNTVGLVATMDQHHGLYVALPSGNTEEPKRYESEDEFIDELPPGHKELQSCFFNDNGIKFYSSEDDKSFFAQLVGPIFSNNKYYQLLPSLKKETQQILISITPDEGNPYAGKMTLTNRTKVDLHSWQLKCDNLKFAIAPQTQLRNRSALFLVFKSPLATIAREESLTIAATFDQDLRALDPEQIKQIHCTLNREEAPVSIEPRH